MQILPINSINYQKSNTFRGLWGTETFKDKSSSGNYAGAFWDDIDHEYTKEYFPFLDETEEQIKQNTEEWTMKSNHYENPYYYDNGQPTSYTYTYNVKMMQRLPFRISEWAKYRANKLFLSFNQQNLIENALRKNNLKQYLK